MFLVYNRTLFQLTSLVSKPTQFLWKIKDGVCNVEGKYSVRRMNVMGCIEFMMLILQGMCRLNDAVLAFVLLQHFCSRDDSVVAQKVGSSWLRQLTKACGRPACCWHCYERG
jgi:hypothetical protein